MATEKSIWIARDAAVFEDEYAENSVRRHPEMEHIYGALHIFYDKPEFDNKSGTFVNGRIMSSVPKYMFPEIKCGTCVEFTAKFPEPEQETPKENNSFGRDEW